MLHGQENGKEFVETMLRQPDSHKMRITSKTSLGENFI